MTVRTMHLRNKSSFTRNECRTPWDNTAFTTPDPLTDELSEVTCEACRAWMIKEGRCPECGSWLLEWSAGPVKLNTVADGRLTMRDTETQFYLGCAECSETLIHGVTCDQVAEALNAHRWRP